MKTLWLVVARGGSKGVPGKNLKQIGGRSLVQWKIDAARAAGATDIVCSSDSTAILDEAHRCGAFQIQRPADLATDTASSADVIKHALYELRENHFTFDQVVLLEPSAPYTTADHYRRALQMMDFHDADLVVGMKQTHIHTSFVGDVRDDLSVTPIILQFQRHARRRQDYPKQWTANGACYVFKTEMFLRTGDIYGGHRSVGMLMDEYHSVEIDTPHDLELAEFYYERGYVKPDGAA